MGQIQVGRVTRSCLLGLAAVASTSLAVIGQSSDDPVLGTWNLVVGGRSTIRVQHRAVRRVGTSLIADGVKATIVTIDRSGASSTVEFVADYDSMEYPIVGSTSADALTLVQLDPLLTEATVNHAGRPMAYARRVISPDGRMMTLTIREVQSGSVNVAVYERKD